MNTHNSALSEPTEEDVQRQLAGEVVRGPRSFRGKALASLSRGLRDLRNKVVALDDTAPFHDVALLHLLAEAHAEDASKRLEKRRALIAATDDVAWFRAVVSLIMDELSEEEIAEAKRVTDDILGIVEKAEVSLEEKKSSSVDPEPIAEQNPMMTP
jgi:hypothetical protein